jgi:hypothetical protein
MISNVTSTPKLTFPLTSVAGAAPKTAADLVTLSGAPTPQQPQSLLKAVGLGAVTTANNNGDVMGRVAGGATSLAGAVGGAYLGSLGGAATMGALGLGAGIPAAILTGSHGLAILGSAFSTGGLLLQGGILIGTACGAVGGYFLGEKLGYAAGYVPTAAVSLPVGAASGVVKHFTGGTVEGFDNDPAKKEEVRKRSKLEKTASSLVGGIGTLSGLAGGGMIGGVIASGAATVNGLVAKDLAISAIMSHGLAGAAIGGAIGAVLLGYGGYKLVQSIGDIAHKSAKTLAAGKESVELDMKSKELDKRIAGLQQAEKNVEKTRAQAEGWFKQQFDKIGQSKTDEDASAAKRMADQDKRKTDMDAKVVSDNAAMDKQQAAVDDKAAHVDTIAQQRADGRLADLEQKDETAYQDRKGKLESWDKSLDARQAEYDRKNREMDKIVDQQSSSRRDATQADLEAKFQTRKGGLDQREAGLKQRQSQLDGRKAGLPNLVRAEGDRLLGIREGELKQSLAGVESGLQSDLRQHQSELQSRYDAQKSQDQQELQSRESSLNSSYQVVASQVSQLQQQVSALQSSANQMAASISQSQSNAQSYRSQAQQLLSSLSSERSALESEAQQARSEASSYQGQLSSAQGQLSSAQSAASQARSDYEQSAQEYNQLQADISRLNNELSNHV